MQVRLGLIRTEVENGEGLAINGTRNLHSVALDVDLGEGGHGEDEGSQSFTKLCYFKITSTRFRGPQDDGVELGVDLVAFRHADADGEYLLTEALSDEFLSLNQSPRLGWIRRSDRKILKSSRMSLVTSNVASTLCSRCSR